MAAETSLVDALKAIPAILKLIPDTQTLPALTVLVVLVIVVAILRTDILKQLRQSVLRLISNPLLASSE